MYNCGACEKKAEPVIEIFEVFYEKNQTPAI